MGKQFVPTDVELINYLKRLLQKQPWPTECPIVYEDIYGDKPPCQIFEEKSLEKVGYFLTQLKKHKISHKNCVRTCAKGTWKGQTKDVPIKDRKGTRVGSKRSFTYENKKGSKKSIWLMKEYYVEDDFFKENKVPKEDYVICKITKNIHDVVKKSKLEEQDVEGVILDMVYEPDDYYSTAATQPDTMYQQHQVVMKEEAHD